MGTSYGSTGFSRFTPAQARGVLLAIAVAAVAAVGVTFSPLSRDNFVADRQSHGDVALYRAEVDRVRAGEGYYQAAAAELHARGYPTRSLFNWRTPLPMWLIGVLPAGWGKALLGGLSLLLLGLAYESVAREDEAAGHRGISWKAIVTALLLTGPLLFTVLGDLHVMPVLWAGVLIAISICCFGLGHWRWGVTVGIAAAFFRELALPYALASALWAYWQRDWRQIRWWLAGMVAWAAFFAWHYASVQGWIQPGDRAHAESWVQFGGAGFLIATTQMNAYLILLPQWVTALFLVAALVGFASWNSPWGLHATGAALVFAVSFAAVGQEFNQYWGSLAAPLWCLGAARAPWAFRDLVRAAMHGMAEPVPTAA